MSYAAQISMLTLMPTILVARGYPISSSLWFTLVMQSGSLAGAITAAFFASRFPRKKVLTGGAVLGFLAGLSIAFLATNIALIIVFGFLFNFSVIILNTTIWLFAPELYPTRVRGMGTSIILAMGSLSGGLFPLVSGVVFDASGLTGMFAMLASLFVVLGIAVQFPPETFGKPMEEDPVAVL
jgi:putative MFS transporter